MDGVGNPAALTREYTMTQLIPFWFMADVSEEDNGPMTRCKGTVEALFSPSGVVYFLNIPVMNLNCHLSDLADGPIKLAAMRAIANPASY